ncbi:MAG: bifunctional oligoribonuclease/PAP phosphatase NrnA [candidate division Zixibacteria bacterium]|nr:bifunctional oligoribonuclease/PAP phosphatase NrnA [candidate division Zixibacteria bacterium]
MNLNEKTKLSNFTNPHKDLILEIEKFFLRSRKIMVVSHVDPDGDAVGTQLAFAAYLEDSGKEVYLVRDSEIPYKYLFLPGVEKIKPVAAIKSLSDIDTALVLECPTLERTGRAIEFIKDRVKIINIDHHQDAVSYGTVNWIDTKASSVGEMACGYFLQVGYGLTPAVAEHLYTAILTDTGRFRYSSTTSRTMTLAGYLIEAGADPRRICDQVYYNIEPSVMKLTGQVLNTMEFHREGRICLMYLTRDMLVQTGTKESDTEGLVDLTMFNLQVQVGGLLKEIAPSQTKLSLRARDDLNVAKIAGHFNGGGHFNAAGCIIPLPMDEARKEIVNILTEAVDAG